MWQFKLIVVYDTYPVPGGEAEATTHARLRQRLLGGLFDSLWGA